MEIIIFPAHLFPNHGIQLISEVEMVVNTANAKILNTGEIYIHDDILTELKFNRMEKKLTLLNLKYGTLTGLLDGDEYTVEFLNVIGFEMTACDFWGPSRRIYSFDLVPEYDLKIIPKMFKIRDDTDKGSEFSSCALGDRENYIEVMITFISGDRLRIACESIVFSDDEAIKYKARTAQPE